MHQKDFRWLSRFGALIGCVGIVIISRPYILGEKPAIDVNKEVTGKSDLDPEHYRILGIPIPNYVDQYLRSKNAVGFLGPIVCFFGAIINAFADLINLN
ncbi:hypothetical protein HA052_22780 [Chromobacterium haemolyticum]|uniref:Uncharacterized protein n=1 Tax=Chromobacterium fluminis TaxID=3044269 RepID=A0ABX0L867_9NEIS|nr:hypothetical protein [Chromobacterium haemolyticum]NHR08019.1 hypothetical protein [Chromobacterium haemolyticum]